MNDSGVTQTKIKKAMQYIWWFFLGNIAVNLAPVVVLKIIPSSVSYLALLALMLDFIMLYVITKYISNKYSIERNEASSVIFTYVIIMIIFGAGSAGGSIDALINFLVILVINCLALWFFLRKFTKKDSNLPIVNSVPR